MRFDFETAARICFGPGRLSEVGHLARPLGTRALIVTGASRRHADRLSDLLAAVRVDSTFFSFAGEPSVDAVRHGLQLAREFGADMVLGLGGGSALDAAKAVAGFLANPGDPLEYLEVIGSGRMLTRSAVPWIAIPTTSGTGAEVTRNAVLGVPERGVKVSLRSSHLFARLALVDPELTSDLPPALTAATGLDALTQLIEPFVCTRANPATDALCRAGLPLAARALERLQFQPQDSMARAHLALASLWSGQALTNAGLGVVHGLAAAIGGMFCAPHGAICANLLAPVMTANLAALRNRSPGHTVLTRYAEIAAWLTGQPDARPEDGVSWVRLFVARSGIPSLASHGVSHHHVPDIITRANAASSTKANPVTLTDEELTDLMRVAIQGAPLGEAGEAERS